jgi:hypothetical protein
LELAASDSNLRRRIEPVSARDTRWTLIGRDANAEFDAFAGLQVGVALGHAATVQRTASTTLTNSHQHPVADGLDDPAAVLGDLGIDEFLATRLERAQRACNSYGPPVGLHPKQICVEGL